LSLPKNRSEIEKQDSNLFFISYSLGPTVNGRITKEKESDPTVDNRNLFPILSFRGPFSINSVSLAHERERETDFCQQTID
jgi:hypothetical protein